MGTLLRVDRLSLLAGIHIRKKRLVLPDRDYRDLLWALFKVGTAADLSERQMAMLIGHLDEIAVPEGMPLAAEKQRIRLRWKLLGRHCRSLDFLVRSMFGVSRLNWLTDPRDIRFLMRQIQDQWRRRHEAC